MRFVFSILIIIFILGISCEKKNTVPEEGIHFFLLSDHETLEPLWEIDDSTIRLEETPLISYGNILSYDQKRHAFKISSAAQESLKSMESDLHTRPFVLVANKEFIYTGYFWSAYSSAICPWMTIDPLHAEYAGELKIEMGYPWLMEDMSIPDRRNDERILNILRQDRKLTD